MQTYFSLTSSLLVVFFRLVEASSPLCELLCVGKSHTSVTSPGFKLVFKEQQHKLGLKTSFDSVFVPKLSYLRPK